MTNIDHDALARRIADAITHNNSAPFRGAVQVTTSECIASVLREALPTSDEKPKLLTPEQVERARKLLAPTGPLWTDEIWIDVASKLLRELLS